jgi:hypothetical protein
MNEAIERYYPLTVTTQGPLYPPSEICNKEGDFIVIGALNEAASDGSIKHSWGAAIVSQDSPVPEFGAALPYEIVKRLDLNDLGADSEQVLFTLALPLPCNNYPMLFAPQQCPDAHTAVRRRLPLHDAIPDFRAEDGRQHSQPITLGQWVKASGELRVRIEEDGEHAVFDLSMQHLVPLSLYTVMSLRAFDLRPSNPTRPGPLGIPNCFVTDRWGQATYTARLANPFPHTNNGNRIINIVVLFMSTQASYGGAIGLHGLGGDVHAQLKLMNNSFDDLFTKSDN